MCFILRNQIELHTVQLEVETSTFLRTSCSQRDKTNTLAPAPIEELTRNDDEKVNFLC